MKFVWSSLLAAALVASTEGNDNLGRMMKRGMMMGEMGMNMAKKSMMAKNIRSGIERKFLAKLDK